MYRFIVTLMLVALLAAQAPAPATAQTAADGEAAAITAVELSELEALGNFNALYDRIHPDAHAVVPRAVVIGWYQNEFAPQGAGVATVTGVRFVEWRWPVTGQTYPVTAEVSFTQSFANAPLLEDVVRLVQDESGEWRWFFGRSREFVDEQIALYVPQAPEPTISGVSLIDSVAADLNAFWATSFEAAGRPYVAPAVVPAHGVMPSSCGDVDPEVSPAMYCTGDQTVYYAPDTFDLIEYAIGDFAWITIMAHEWGHHVQTLEGYAPGPGTEFELQADCLAGSYARDAETRGRLSPGDITAALSVSAASGSPVGLPQDTFALHGTSDERVTAFMLGYLDGFIGCDFMLGVSTLMPAASPSPDLVTLLPLQSEVPSDLLHANDQSRTLEEIAGNYTDSAATELLFRLWGWEDNATRTYQGSGANSGITSVYVSLHRFEDEWSALEALDYSLADQAASTGAWEVPAMPLGETSRALETSADTTLYVQQGDVLLRLTVAGQADIATPTAESIMQSMLGRLP